MNTIRHIKRNYLPPKVDCIKLDNEISLVLESNPPTGPGEEFGQNTTDFFKNDPFKIINT